MQKLERDSRIRGYLRMHTDRALLVSALAIRQREEYDRHAQTLSQLEVFAHEWREAGMRGIPRWRGGQPQERQTLKSTQPSTPDEFLNYISSEHHKADKGAVLLGNVALSLYEAFQDGVFSLYRFTARYNNDVQGTDSAELPFIHFTYPDLPLTQEEKTNMKQSLHVDPTGVHLIAHPKLWPRELALVVSSERLEEEREEMTLQLPYYKHFAKKVLQENPDASRPYAPKTEFVLEPNVSRQILDALGEF